MAVILGYTGGQTVAQRSGQRSVGWVYRAFTNAQQRLDDHGPVFNANVVGGTDEVAVGEFAFVHNTDLDPSGSAINLDVNQDPYRFGMHLEIIGFAEAPAHGMGILTITYDGVQYPFNLDKAGWDVIFLDGATGRPYSSDVGAEGGWFYVRILAPESDPQFHALNNAFFDA